MALEVFEAYWERFLGVVEPHLPVYLHWNEICWTFVFYLAELRRHIHRWCRGLESWQIVVNTVLICLCVWLVSEILRWLYSWIFCQDEGFITRMKKVTFKMIRRLPFVKDKINAELSKTKNEMKALMNKGNEHYYTKLPNKGMGREVLLKEVDKYENMGKINWKAGRVSGTVYHGGKELTDVLSEAYKHFTWSNPLHPDVFPGVRKMEAEVVKMCVNMFNGGPQACGTTTSGGTESILLACKTYRDWAKEEKGIKKAEIIAPVSVHAAFEKAAAYFNMKLILVPVNEKTRKCDVRAMRRAITRNTALLVGSCPSYPHGVIDSIEEIAKLGKRYNIGVHVDCCLGGFLVPFMKDAGFSLAPFDFTVDGVTSISVDTHKYGFAPKGSSVILYNTQELRHYQFFVSTDWTGGIYACPTIPGSRSGGIIAACWAAMMYMGEQGYIDCTKKIIKTREYIEKGLRQIKGIFVYGEPEVCVVGFGSDNFDIFALGNELTENGWNMNSLQYPSGIHICVTMPITQSGVADKFIKDVKEATAKIMKNPKKKTTGGGAIYGMAQQIPDRSMVSELACSFIDSLYTTDAIKIIEQNGHTKH
ncbi:sphingosine-1-phosphate lyase 1-like isoform X2 [Xenia sp. Carnegie-2017]|uniref:sphingosine-1-phosphate lyase 1-like isoform X2 n=1 Tax=Xenia sp. Carnegie-2017 TaxID=2897299 RepID=UPI001F043852|nr:sphingosine-1-phosphate lyase 1-like isoform X2 [Xenia sp. Carnegie-2017]